jgi:hypothetical protein
MARNQALGSKYTGETDWGRQNASVRRSRQSTDNTHSFSGHFAQCNLELHVMLGCHRSFSHSIMIMFISPQAGIRIRDQVLRLLGFVAAQALLIKLSLFSSVPSQFDAHPPCPISKTHKIHAAVNPEIFKSFRCC